MYGKKNIFSLCKTSKNYETFIKDKSYVWYTHVIVGVFNFKTSSSDAYEYGTKKWNKTIF